MRDVFTNEEANCLESLLQLVIAHRLDYGGLASTWLLNRGDASFQLTAYMALAQLGRIVM